MRFITEMDGQIGRWLVVDTENNNEIAGIHELATLAALDAFKREKDNCQEELVTLLHRQEGLLTLLQHKTAA